MSAWWQREVEERYKELNALVTDADFDGLMVLANRMSHQLMQRVQQRRWDDLLHFLSSHNENLTPAALFEKVRIAKQRITLESDIGRVLQAFAHSDGCTEGIDLKTLRKELIGKYNINTKYQDFGQNFPEDDHLVFFKVVAVVGNKFFSIYDGKTEYDLNVTMHQDLETTNLTKSGFFVHKTLDAALKARFPPESALIGAPRAVLKVITPPNANIKVWKEGSTFSLEIMTPIEVLYKFGKLPQTKEARSAIRDRQKEREKIERKFRAGSQKRKIALAKHKKKCIDQPLYLREFLDRSENTTKNKPIPVRSFSTLRQAADRPPKLGLSSRLQG